MNKSLFTHIQAVVDTGRATISADDDVIVAIVQEAIKSGRTATFCLTYTQAKSVRSWYFTPERIEASKIEFISDEEKHRIKSELGIDGIDSFRSNRIQCKCGQDYGAFEFLQQGIREHGEDVVKTVLAHNNFTMFNINRTLVKICPSCDQTLGPDDGYEYDCDDYGGCSYPI